jgi:acetylornithine/succinyldiaminopimelate/putrescine aminotransferase
MPQDLFTVRNAIEIIDLPEYQINLSELRCKNMNEISKKVMPEEMARLRKAMINDRSEHPERTNATMERLVEVLVNVLEDRSFLYSRKFQDLLVKIDNRKPLNEEQADMIIEVLNDQDFDMVDLGEITRQLMLSEISTAEAIDLHNRYKIPVSKLESDIIPIKGNGAKIMDTKGKWFIDMDSNYSATNLGMSNSEIAKGLYNQASQLISMKEDRVQIARARFLKRISSIMPEGLNHFYWQNSGGEAVDKALKIAKAYTRTTDIIAFKGGFHGRTHGAVSVTWNEKYRRPFGLHDEKWVHFADFNDLESVRKIMNETVSKIVILEMIQGEEAGNRPATQKFIDSLWKLAKERDCVIIDDEVQAGFGRSAEKEGNWFACETYGVIPHIMVIGKSFGGGYPVTAVVSNKDISDAMKPGYDGSTFGGNPMAMTSALIATRQMEEMNVTKNVVKRSRQFVEGLESLKKKYPVIEEIRGKGLMLSFSVGKPENVKILQNSLMKHGVKSSLSTGKYVRFLPPTIISEKETEETLQKLESALKDSMNNMTI